MRLGQHVADGGEDEIRPMEAAPGQVFGDLPGLADRGEHRVDTTAVFEGSWWVQILSIGRMPDSITGVTPGRRLRAGQWSR